MFRHRLLQKSETMGLYEVIITRRMSEGRKREDVASDVNPSLAYASGWDIHKKRNFKVYDSIYSSSIAPKRNDVTHFLK
jgi:hypothetical protein